MADEDKKIEKVEEQKPAEEAKAEAPKAEEKPAEAPKAEAKPAEEKKPAEAKAEEPKAEAKTADAKSAIGSFIILFLLVTNLPSLIQESNLHVPFHEVRYGRCQDLCDTLLVDQ